MIDSEVDAEPERTKSPVAAALSGALIGVLGGLIGLGGAEFRLPVLISYFGFSAIEAIILNKAMSLVVVASALPFRASAVSLQDVAAHWTVIANLLLGSLAGAWIGASVAVRLNQDRLHSIIAGLLVLMAVVLLFGHQGSTGVPPLTQPLLAVAGIIAGFLIGVVASLLGVAGGELLIPTFVLLFGIDIKLAGSLSLATSLPTMLVGFTRYSRDQSFAVLARNKTFVIVLAGGSLLGSFIGGRLLEFVSTGVLLPMLSALLVLSVIKLSLHKSK